MSCFRKVNGSQPISTSNIDGPCSATSGGSISPCCPIKATGNLCLSSFLCWEEGPPPGGTGFLTASCTDSSYQSGQCTQHCANSDVPDITYNSVTGLWACCGWSKEGGVDCNNPTNETWSAPAPDILLAAAKSSSSIYPSSTASTSTRSSSTSASSITSTTITGTASTTASTATPTSSAGASSSSSTTESSSSGLSTGAKAGIVIGIAVAVIGLIVLAFFLGRRQRRKKQSPAAAEPYRPTKPAAHEAAAVPSSSDQKYNYNATSASPPTIEKYGREVHETFGENATKRGSHWGVYELS